MLDSIRNIKLSVSKIGGNQVRLLLEVSVGLRRFSSQPVLLVSIHSMLSDTVKLDTFLLQSVVQRA